ncbi:CPBP family intramembrane glutamic endopeptidase [Companilactobacillus futsaii]|uniref:CPBP family intramembrane metalloprotease n=2 Tax=Companilactobacillus futsaii TaxID=938155 RepID=A0A5B7T4Y5_9LACO|nr:CPBP family intramembrane glutamic endopeptidase [Companilactobacillus futsaii]KRK92357.1 CAAX family membrane-bound protease [Companilactobacillus futsaii JCM 17355]QCX25432.1 CPBP family intramembrane metalloprotease [Companilactobacillus futsaii]
MNNNLEFSYNNRFSRNNKDKSYFILFKAQVILNALIFFWYSAVTKNLFLFIPIFLNLLALYLKPSPEKIIDRINYIFQLFFQSVTIAESYHYLISVSMRLYNWNLPSSIALLLITMLVIYIPYIRVFFGAIHSKTLQLLISIFCFAILAMNNLNLITYGTILYFNPFLSLVINSSFLGGITFMILILVLMTRWGYGLPKMRLSKNVNWGVLSLVLIFSLWFVLWNAFGSGNVITSFFHFNFSGINLKPQYILSGLEAGIAEELLFRYAFLTILLVAFKNSPFHIFWASIISSLCFGLLHLGNISAGQNLASTIEQVIFAFGMGLLMCGIYLYTDLFYLPVIIHFLLDTLVFSVSGELMSGKVTTADNILTIIETLVFIIIALLLLKSVYNRRNRSFNGYFS